MSAPTTASSTSNAPAQNTQASAAGRNGPAGTRRGAEAGADNSLFAHLLLLLGSAGEPPLAATGTEADAPLAEDALRAAEDAPDDNPLAALAGWPGSPVPADAAGEAAASARGGATDAPSATLKELQAADQASAEQAVDTARALANPVDPADRAAHDTPAASHTAARTPGTHKGLSPTALAQAVGLPSQAAARPAPGTGTPALTAPDGTAFTWRRTGGSDATSAGLAAPVAAARSTVTFNERFGQFNAVDLNPAAVRDPFKRGAGSNGSSAGAVAAGAPGGIGTGTEAVAGAGGASGGDLSGAGHGSDSGAGEPGSSGGDTAGAQSADTDDTAISHWGTQNLRQASLRVGQEGEAIDIQLSVQGQEVQVDFRTDDAQARQTLENSADGTLAELLQRSGIQLAGVSVGAHGQPGQGRQGAAGETGNTRTSRIGNQTEADTAAAAPTRPQPPRADGSRPLDLFV